MKALVLSGGGSKGLAHIGVIKAIEEKKLKFDFIVGCSMGSLVGSLYALGYSSDAIKSMAILLVSQNILTFKLSLSEFFDSKKIEMMLDEIFGDKQFKDTKIPIYITAVDLLTYHHIVFNSGYLKYAIRASISLPLVFKPVMMNGRVLIDGGIFETLPLSVAKKLGANYIVAVNVVGSLSENIFIEGADEMKQIDYGFIKTALNSIYILQRSQIQHTISSYKPNILINVDTSDIDPLNFKIDLNDIIERGYKTAKEVLK
ncbi:MAG: patatin-like phospholipase family protein [candidate division WOR-3 bacterium]|jgi:NTE family protein